jgi:hypothetical protein
MFYLELHSDTVYPTVIACFGGLYCMKVDWQMVPTVEELRETDWLAQVAERLFVSPY